MSGGVEGVALLPDDEMVYQSLRFLFWAAGEGFSPINKDDGPDPEDVFWQYSLRTGDEDWETLAERYRTSRTTPPARSYADGVEDAAKVADAIATGKMAKSDELRASSDPIDVEYSVAFHRQGSTGQQIAAAIRLLSQGGGKARHEGWTEKGHDWLDAGATLATSGSQPEGASS